MTTHHGARLAGAQRAARARDRMEEVFVGHFDAVRAFCLRRLSVAEANDVVAEVFLVAWQKIDDLPDDPFVRPWLLRIAHFRVHHARRSFSRRARLAQRLSGQAAPPGESPEAFLVAQYQRDRVTAALAKLRESDREIVRLRAWEELTAPQIAMVLDISVAAAEKRISRALDRLGTALGKSPFAAPGNEGGS